MSQENHPQYNYADSVGANKSRFRSLSNDLNSILSLWDPNLLTPPCINGDSKDPLGLNTLVLEFVRTWILS